ncbi:hypothetical protein L1887_57763 [Cichorium endivia]|nr:hypothetical protein L1887_57763 [Cichorium endivia]
MLSGLLFLLGNGLGLVHGVVPVDVVGGTLDAILLCAEDGVPETGLFAVVAGLFPTLSVVDVVVLEAEFGAKVAQDPGAGVLEVAAQTGMACGFDEEDVASAEPPGGKVDAPSEPGEDGDADHVHELLFVVGKSAQCGDGVFGQVVRLVQGPEKVDLVHETVVPVEPKVDGGGKHEHVDRHHQHRLDIEQGCRRVVQVGDCDEGSRNNDHEKTDYNAPCADVRNSVARGGTVKRAEPVGHIVAPSKDAITEPNKVREVERGGDVDGNLDAGQVREQVVHEQGCGGLRGDQAVHLPHRVYGHGCGFGIHRRRWTWAFRILGCDAEGDQHALGKVPLRRGLEVPRRGHASSIGHLVLHPGGFRSRSGGGGGGGGGSRHRLDFRTQCGGD